MSRCALCRDARITAWLELLSYRTLGFESFPGTGAYSERDAARLVREVASALNFLHGIGVVHSDLKPENVLLTTSRRGDSVVKLADFGCSQIFDDENDDDDSDSDQTFG